MESELRFRRPLFWDVNENDIEKTLVESDSWVVVRAFEFGTLEDIFNVIALYGKERVKDILIKEKLQPLSAAMAFLFLGVDAHKKYVF
jgi:hypothetical protein